MKVDFREICKTLFLCIASVNLGFSSGFVLAGIIFAALFIYLHIKKFVVSVPEARAPRYKKSIAYLGLVPCIIWWVLTPGVDYGVSPFVVFIPAWYLLFLAWLQKRSVGNGAYEVFVAFNGVAVVFLGLFHAPKPCVLCGGIAILLSVFAYRRPRTALYKHLAFALLFAAFGAASFGGWQYWKSHRHYGGHWARDYYEKNRMMGFDPVAALGSFNSNYTSRYNNQVILRVWDTLAPEYLRAAVYEKYVAGIWKLPPKPMQKLYPSYYQVDYAVFESADSITRKPNVKSVWVQAALDNFGFMFASPTAIGVAAKNADSLDYYSTHVFAGANGHRGDWYYFESEHENPMANDSLDSTYLRVGKQYLGFVDSVSQEIGALLPDSSHIYLDVESVATAIKTYFLLNFRYSLHIPNLSRSRAQHDPLRAFWKAREGYCEYFATLAVLVLRHYGIPARYVTGFVHPERVPGRPYVLFRRHHSHAWVEVYAQNQWMPFDPTPPIFVREYASPSYLQSKWEGIRGRVAHLFHLLKEGGWRRTVDSWQTVTQSILESPYFYGALLILFALIVVLKFKGRQGVNRRHLTSNQVAYWISILNQAEKRLAKFGYVRNPGETVAAFANRVELHLHSIPQELQKKTHRKICSESIESLKRYEQSRWIS